MLYWYITWPDCDNCSNAETPTWAHEGESSHAESSWIQVRSPKAWGDKPNPYFSKEKLSVNRICKDMVSEPQFYPHISGYNTVVVDVVITTLHEKAQQHKWTQARERKCPQFSKGRAQSKKHKYWGQKENKEDYSGNSAEKKVANFL